MTDALLSVRDLRVQFRTRRGPVTALDGVDYDVYAGRTLAVVGESGSGKSVTARAIMGLLPRRTSTVTGGRIMLGGRDLLSMSKSARQAVRGERIAMVFQDALSALNPVLPVGFQISEGARKRRHLDRRAARQLAVDLMDQVGIPAAKARVGAFPHEFSGGMRQRVLIAMALAQDPEILIADEPTTALDVTIQAQILRLLTDLQAQRQMGLVLITHDMGVVANTADEIAVMYCGRIVEQGSCGAIFESPAHPYTQALLDSIPRPELRGTLLPAIPGSPPDPAHRPSGCSFRTRCPRAFAACVDEPPVVRWLEDPRVGQPPPAAEPVPAAGQRLSACHLCVRAEPNGAGTAGGGAIGGGAR
ncbi:ABC transporter ATP-binding protein [Nakamurella lactea]|uniref:ABC transporter ATP-binding protein n=1 Tax=Nakamurella lactea TaxID=459515 RepID=UPI00041836DB|nr:ABC transporter ATP-binding protein [Nakamurella lactea]